MPMVRLSEQDKIKLAEAANDWTLTKGGALVIETVDDEGFSHYTLVPAATMTQIERARVVYREATPEPDPLYYYLVSFTPGGHAYTYASDHGYYREGDMVIVPADKTGRHPREVRAEITGITTRPVSPSFTIKKIIGFAP